MKPRNAFFMMFLIALSASLMGGYALYSSMRDEALKTAHQTRQRRVETVKDQIEAELKDHRRSANLISTLQEINRALGPDDGEAVRLANKTLKTAMVIFETSACYLINAQGLTVAASNWDTPTSFVGKNYAFRPYFQQAIQGHPYIYTAIGVTSKEPGIYFSHPVYGSDNKVPIGVVVIKDTISDLKKLLSIQGEERMVIADPAGFIFVSSRSDWQNHLLAPISEKQRSHLLESRQFGVGPFLLIGMKTVNASISLNSAGDVFVRHTAPVDTLPGWQIVHFHSQKNALNQIKTPLMEKAVYGVLFFLLFIGLTALLFNRIRHHEMKAMQAGKKAIGLEKAYFESLIENMPDAVVCFEIDNRIRTANKGFGDMFGFKDIEQLNQGLENFIVPRDRIAESHDIQHRISKRELIDIETVRKRRNGEEFSVSLRSVPIFFKEEQEILGHLVIYRDISERKKALKAIQDARIKAEESTRTKSEFLANMSHEIRTPMNGVLGMAGLLLSTELTPEQHDYATTIQVSGEALLSLINDILDFSKIEAGRLDFEIIEFDLRSTLEDIVDLSAFKAQEKGLEYILFFHPDVPTRLLGDPGRLRQVIINLVNNAIKFTETGEVVIEVTLAGETRQTCHIRFAVKDTGIGIPENKQDHLFKAFSQVDGSITRKYGGTGLGLSISKRLVALMKGDIEVESQEGKGSEFWFTAQFEKPEASVETLLTPMEDIQGKRILIVDDNKTNRFVFREQLRSWGCRFDEASGGREALEILRREAVASDGFDIAIIDMQMPEMSGDQLGAIIRQEAALSATRLVMISSAGLRGDAKNMERLGFSGYLTKPVKQSRLYDCLTAVMGISHDVVQPSPLVTRHVLSETKRQKLRLLLAEDNITNQKVAAGILGKLGYSVDIVCNGKEAVKALETIPYALVLMDCHMPQMDGYEATAAIRSPGSAVINSRVPIIALTADAMESNRKKSLAAGMNDYLSKPVNPEELERVITTWLATGADASKRTGTLDINQNKPSSQKIKTEKPVSDVSPEVFNYSALLERLMGDKQLTNTIVDAFLTDLGEQVQQLAAFLESDDTEAAAGQAHKIKGAAGNVGAQAMQAVALAVETAAKSNDLDELHRLKPDLLSRYQEVRNTIKEQL